MTSPTSAAYRVPGPQSVLIPGKWVVVRHSGRTDDPWRRRYVGDSRSRAWAIYDRLALKLRQGAVMLYDPGGLLIAGQSAPRLRTRW